MAGAGNSKESISLNLNPMLDIFSILITFLLMSFSTDPVNHDVRQGLELPDSTTVVALDELPTLSVSKSEIFVNDLKVADIIGGDVPKEQMSQGAVFPVFEELKKLADANKALLKTVGTKKKINTLTMEMDKSHEFKLIRRLMLSAQQAEFITFKLMVAKPMD